MKQIVAFIFYSFLAVGAVFAQTAAILPQGVTQYFDNNGNPLTSGRVYNYIPGTLTFKTTWQDSGETIANTNPVVLDAAGRAKILGQGAYRQIVRKSNGDLVWDAVTTATGSGGGGSTSTGDGDLVGTIKPWAGLTAPNQYVFAYGQEISRTTFSTLLTAITQTINNILCTSASPILTGFSDTTQINIGGPVEISCMAAGTIVLSKTSSTVTVNHNATVSTTATGVFYPFGNGDGSTTFNVPDLRGYVVAGRDNMGGIAASRLTAAYFAPPGQGQTGGTQSSTLSTSNLPAYTPSGTISQSSIVTQMRNTVNVSLAGGAANLAVRQGDANNTQTDSSTISPITFNGTAQGGTNAPFPIVQPTMTLNYIIKVTPDTNSASASGVTDIEGMTGSIACGSGLSCTGNVIGLTNGSNFVTGPVSSTSGAIATYNGISGNALLNNTVTISQSELTVAGAMIRANYGTPTIASGACGTGSNGVITSGTNQAGLITIGSSSTTTCTISFSTTLTHAPSACVITPHDAGAADQNTTRARVFSISTSAWVISGAALTSTSYYYMCM